MKKFFLIAVVVILVSLTSLLILRFTSGNEDGWICTNNEWIKHGNPSNPKPLTPCGEAKKDNGDLKTEITNAFAKKYTRPIDTFIIETKIDTGLFAKGTINFKDEGGGGLWFAAKSDKGWELAFDGNGIISCDIVNKYNFPVSIISGCIDTQNNNKFIQR